MSRWLRILDPLGKVAAFFGLLMTAPAAVSLILADGLALTHLSAAAATFAAGVCITLAGRPFRRDLQARQGLLLVVVIWLLLPCFATLPLMGALPELEFSFAYFEAASGLTASGGTVLSGLDSLPPSLNFWRGEMIWIGGMGLIVLAVAIFPLIGAGGHGVFNAEMPGPIKDNKLTPRVTQTAKALWVIYAGLTCLCALAYFAAGMSGLDAVIHAFTTLGLGGFSSHDASYGYFDSAAVEGVAMVFMILAGMNFTLHFSAWTGRNPLTYFRSQECRAYLWTMAAAVTTVFLYLHSQEVYGSAWETLRYAAFNTVSIVTTTGYSSDDFGAWPLFAPMLMLILANVTACAGSTGGGIKMSRTLIALNQTGTERQKLTHPLAYYDTKIGGESLPQKILASVLFFLVAYLFVALALALALLATGMDFLTAFSAAFASISNTGPGLGEVGPSSNYAHLTPAQIWLCSAAMLVGRLELLSFLAVAHASFWRY